jgi:tetratricopeptide (TPR) repeat protein
LRSILVGLIFFLAAASFAHADDGAVADREKLKRAQIHFNLGKFEQAAAAYEELYERHPDEAVLLFNIAQSYRLGQNHERALFFYRRYLANFPKAKNRREVERRIAQLEKLDADKRAAAAGAEPQEAPQLVAPTATAEPPEVTSTTVTDAPPPETAPVPPPRRDKPVHKKWWFWTALVGGAVVVAGAVTVAVLLTRPEPFESPVPPFGPGAMPSTLQVRW